MAEGMKEISEKKKKTSEIPIEQLPEKKEFGMATQESLGVLRDRIDVERGRPLEDWEVEHMRFTRSTIRRVATAIGDYNPLYFDLDYAKKSPHGTIILPPGVMQHIEQINARTDGMPGMHALFRGLTLMWKRPIRMGEVVLGKTYLQEAFASKSQLSGISVIQDYESIGKTPDGEEVARVYTSWSRHQRAAAAKSKGARQKGRDQAWYTDEDLEKIKQAYKNEIRQGADPLFWEDVKVGDEITPVVKGPTCLAQRMFGEGGAIVSSETKIGGSGDWGVQHAQFWKLLEKHPGLPYYNEQGVPEVPVTIHNDNERAQRYLGLPGAYDAGMQRVNWTVHALTNWMGDHGFLRKLTIIFRQINIMGDTTWCGGKVIDKRVEDGKHVVDLEIWNRNEVPHEVTTGSAEIVLPSKDHPATKTWE
jgi:acyl dehydratase